MESQPLVSIVLPTYNSEKYIQRALESALCQTYKNIELVIVDGGSIDETRAIISDFADRDARIHPVLCPNRLNFVKSLNRGIAVAKGEYIARLDSDDFWCDSEKIEKQVRVAIESPGTALVGGGIIVVDEEGKEILRIRHPREDHDIRRRILFDSPFAHSTVLFRRDICELVGGYDEQLDYCEDWDLWLRMGRAGTMYNLPDYFVCYTQGKHNRSNRVEDCKAAFKIRRRYRNGYCGFHKAWLFGWVHYLYCYLPISVRRSVRRVCRLTGAYR